MDSKCYENFICPHLPLAVIVGNEEEVLLSFAPARNIVIRIFTNMARLYRFIFIIIFSIIDVILLWICIPLLIQSFQTDILIFFIVFLTLFSGADLYLIISLLNIKTSTYDSLPASEYILTKTKLYLKMVRIAPPKKERPPTCLLQIIELPLIRSLRLHQSFWDKRYKETGSIRIKLASPHRSLKLHNLPQPETVMNHFTNILNSLEH